MAKIDKNSKFVGDYGEVAKLLQGIVDDDRARNQVPLLGENDEFTGQFYDRRDGQPEGQPNPARLTAHLRYMQSKNPDAQLLQTGEPIDQFDPIEQYESEGLLGPRGSIPEVAKQAYGNSLTGIIEKAIDADDVANLFGLFDAKASEGFQPNTVESIAAEVGTFFMPADLATIYFGGGAGIGGKLAGPVSRALGTGLAGRAATRATISASALGTYEGARSFFANEPAEDILNAIKRGATFGAALGAVGGLIPRVIKGSQALGYSAGVAGEIVTFGTLSPLMDDRIPTVEDYAHAAGFVVGMRITSGYGEIKRSRYERQVAAQAEKMRKAVEEGKLTTEVLASEIDNIFLNTPNAFNAEVYQKIKDAPEGNTKITLGELFTGTYLRKVLKLETRELSPGGNFMDAPIIKSSKPPENTGFETGWVTRAKNGQWSVFINPKFANHEGLTLAHEAWHIRQIQAGHDPSSRVSEKRAEGFEQWVKRNRNRLGRLKKAEYVKLYNRSKKGRTAKSVSPGTVADALTGRKKQPPKPSGGIQTYKGKAGSKAGKTLPGGTPYAPGKRSTEPATGKGEPPATPSAPKSKITAEGLKRASWQKKVTKEGKAGFTIGRGETSELADRVKTRLQEVTPKNAKNPVSDRFIFTKPSKRTVGKGLYGDKHAGVAIGVQDVGGRDSWVLLDVSASNVTGRRALYNEALARAKKAKRQLFISSRIAESPMIKQLVVDGAIKKNASGRRLIADKPIDTGGEVSYRRTGKEPQDVEAMAKKYGVKITGFQEGPKGPKQFINIHDPLTGGDYLVKDASEIPIKVIQKRSEFKVPLDKTPYRRTAYTNADIAAEIHPTLRKVFERFDKLIPPVMKAAKNRTTTEEGREVAEMVLGAHEQASLIEGQLLSELKDLGVTDLNPGLFSRPQKRAELTAEAEALGRRIRQTDDKGVGPEPGYRDWYNRIWKMAAPFYEKATGKKLGKVMASSKSKGDRGYLNRELKSDVREELLGDLTEMENVLDKMERAAKDDPTKRFNPDLIVGQALLKATNKTRALIEHVTTKTGQTSTALDAIRRVKEDLLREQHLVPSYLEARKLDYPAEFYETDARILLTNYAHAMSKWVAEQHVMGTNQSKVNTLLEKLSRGEHYEEAKLVSQMVDMWTGRYEMEHRLSPLTKKVVGIYTGLEVGFKIGMGGATLLNIGQPLISIIPDMGLWNTLKGGLDLLDPVARKEIRQSGILNNMEGAAIHAVAGFRPGGWAGSFADWMTKISGFQSVNKGLLYLSAATVRRVLPRLQQQARAGGRNSEWAKKRLSDFNIKWNEPMTDIKLKKAMFRFATDSQLQWNFLNEPLIINDPKWRALFLFKRFGVRQASYMKDMLKRELIARGNPMPLIRLALGGALGGTGIAWALNNVKSFLSGEEVYRKDDGMFDALVENLGTIGAFGFLSDMASIDKLSRIGSAIKFATFPVIASDVEKALDAMTSVLEDYEKYGDAWFVTKRNTHRLFDPFGTYTRALGKRTILTGHKANRLKYKRGIERTDIFNLIMKGKGEAAANRIRLWNKHNPELGFGMDDISFSKLREWLERKAKNYAQTLEKKKSTEAVRLERKQLGAYLKQAREQREAVNSARAGVRR